MKTAQRDFTFRRGEVRIDANARVLYVKGKVAKLGSRAFALLETLLERRDRLVPKQELMDLVWPGLVVEENNLQVHVMTLRKLLGPDAIVTVSGRGYRFALIPDIDEASRAEGAPTSGETTALHRLPAPSTRLIGREALTASICSLVRRNDVRLVTLTGPGGSGKTRVSLWASAQLAHDFADGSYMVMLAPVRDPTLVPSAIAAVLNLQETGNRSPEELIISQLRDREVLLTLDNFEHVVAAAPLVTRLLDACTRLKVMVTSRAVLKLSAEHDVVVPPLALPELHASAKRIAESAAVQLFVERAQATGQPVGTSETDSVVLGQICRRLDGLPLAIELAAARLRVLSPQALLVRLEHRLQLLKTGASDLPERQRTLRSAIAWSYELLEPLQQKLFRRLAVFVGGWSLEAAEATAGNADLSQSVLDLLEALVDQNLVQRIEDVNGEPRFTMLETVREFAEELLEASGEQSDMRQRHADYFTSFAQKVEPKLTSPNRKPWLNQSQVELNNFRAAFGWLIDSAPDPERALRLGGSLAWMWYFMGQFGEGRSWLKRALELPGAEKHPAVRAKALSGAARLSLYAGDPTEAVHLAQKSVDLWRAACDPGGLALALFHLGIGLLMLYKQAEAQVAFQESLQCFEESHDSWGVALALSYLGIALTFMPSREPEARRTLLEGRARFAALGDDWGRSTSTHYLGSMALKEGDYATARELSEEMLQAARDLNDYYRVSRSLYQLAEIAFAEKHYEKALEHLKASLALVREQGRAGDAAQLLRFFARLEHARQHPDRTVRLLAGASTLSSRERTFPHDDPIVNQSALDDARQALGERRFEVEWAKGSGMSFEEAVSWALTNY